MTLIDPRGQIFNEFNRLFTTVGVTAPKFSVILAGFDAGS
jgi:hypothetical protein